MDINTQNWLSESLQSGGLSSCFVDCQRVEYSKPRCRPHFEKAGELVDGLRSCAIEINHFMLDETGRKCLEPFKYRDKKRRSLFGKKLIPNKKTDFQVVVPKSYEWIFPKTGSNGFENSHASRIVNRPNNSPTVLIFAGFIATDCLRSTIIGSFNVANDPSMHKIVFATDATDSYGSTNDYIRNIRRRIQSSAQDNVGHGTVSEILNCLPR